MQGCVSSDKSGNPAFSTEALVNHANLCFFGGGWVVVVQGMGRVLVNIMTSFAVNVCCASDSCLHVTPKVVHSFVTTNVKQSSTKQPAIVAEGYLMCQCFPNMHSAAGFSVPFFFLQT